MSQACFKEDKKTLNYGRAALPGRPNLILRMTTEVRPITRPPCNDQGGLIWAKQQLCPTNFSIRQPEELDRRIRIGKGQRISRSREHCAGGHCRPNDRRREVRRGQERQIARPLNRPGSIGGIEIDGRRIGAIIQAQRGLDSPGAGQS